MNKNDYNNEHHEQKNHLYTLGDLRDALLEFDMPDAERALMRSALKRVDEVIGHGMLDYPANQRLVLERLEQVSPAMAGMTEGSYANLKSRTRKAFRLVQTHGKFRSPRSRYALTGEWGELQRTLDVKAQRATSRLFHFAAGLGVLPHKMSDAVVERFTLHLRDEAMLGDWERVRANGIKAWNRLSAFHEHLPVLTPPPVKRTSYWIPFDQWPPTLVAELETFLQFLSAPSDFVTRNRKVLKPGTVKQYRHNFSILVSALVHSGVSIDTLVSLADVIGPEHVNLVLQFLHERAGGKVTPSMFQLALRVRTIASWCNMRQEDLDRLDEIFLSVKDQSSRRRGMTPKNRALLDKLDDQRFADQVQLLPFILLDRAEKNADKPSAPALARTAVAIEILLICSVRRANLVDLELGKSIRKIGHGKDGFWIIEREGVEVKNEEDLRFRLDGQTVTLLETYLRDWRPRLCPVPSPWLFPAADGGCIDPKAMAYAIGTQSKRVLGVAITPHQFRHISAELYLKDKPEDIYTISQHLAHRDVNTTRHYYARPQQRQASRHFQEHVLRSRETAQIRIKRAKRPKGAGGFDEKSDLL